MLQGPDRQGSPVDPALTQRPVTPAPPEWSSYDAPINFTWVQCLSFLLHHHLSIFSSHTQQQKVNLVKTPVNSSPLYSIFFQLSGDPRRVVWDGMAKESRPGAENLCDILISFVIIVIIIVLTILIRCDSWWTKGLIILCRSALRRYRLHTPILSIGSIIQKIAACA